jgi:hypothetical protein
MAALTTLASDPAVVAFGIAAMPGLHAGMM